ncbi:MAG: flagellar basal body rod protein FlgB, partial [Sulfuricurvum sp.]|uniref:flagellar basal body rod protein FlgB n=1 Tax=Sulfuricurvum sp. TaxID=2025608 RepID=UPI0025E18AAA
MGITVSRAHDLMQNAMNYRSARQDIIAGNIANADTPFYRPKDISFEDTLAQKSAEIFRDKSQTLQMAQTNGAHLGPIDSGSSKPTTFFRDGHMARNDGNSVDLDVETTEMAKNSTMFNALTAAIKKDSNLFKSVIDASSKT